MGRLLLSLFLSAFFALSLSANCGMKDMHKGDCQKENCPMHMKKQSCDMPKCKNENCNMKMKAHGKHSMNKDDKKCACGMTIESCKKMMISCKFRDQREAQTKE